MIIKGLHGYFCKIWHTLLHESTLIGTQVQFNLTNYFLSTDVYLLFSLNITYYPFQLIKISHKQSNKRFFNVISRKKTWYLVKKWQKFKTEKFETIVSKAALQSCNQNFSPILLLSLNSNKKVYQLSRSGAVVFPKSFCPQDPAQDLLVYVFNLSVPVLNLDQTTS